jgi:hypothetical protein
VNVGGFFQLRARARRHAERFIAQQLVDVEYLGYLDRATASRNHAGRRARFEDRFAG